MNVDFSPKKQFQANADVARELTKVVDSGNFHIALSSALSEFVYRRTPNAEQLTAVRDFIGTLLHLPFKDEPLPSFPMKQLDYTVYERREPPTTKP